MKIVVGLMAVFAVILMAGTGGALLICVDNYRTEAVTNQYVVTTPVGNTTSIVQLSKTLWNADTSNSTVASNITADLPVTGTYTDGNRALQLTNLAENTTRVITVDYRTYGLSDYPQADTAAKTIPVLLIAAALFVAVGACIYIVVG